MGIFKRVKTIAAADFHHVLDKCEDPVSMVKQYMRALEAELAKAQSALGNQLYFEQKHEGHIRQVKQTIEDRKRQQKLALEKKNDEIAKMAIQDRLELEKKLQALEAQLEGINGQTNQLKAQVVKLKETYADLQNRKTLLLSRATTARTSYKVKNTLFSSQSESILNGFARMEDKVLHLEAKASALDYFSKTKPVQDKSYSLEVEEEFIKAKEAMEKQA
ncbi:hypothetical protein WQ54_04055 [Bacillus sp. SA1-12]|uniref:PspA/IM30 family protein n=1 Tax=Bacillus sp. SA1-12 TaxID=1455638 RepID=UPI000626020C|nr:PspA/IM30 family protein [Bacillus sp. SA1-12]KKI93419.1 hypothetical protein WQ54_04055 [Bacillus sp. SA1-12]